MLSPSDSVATIESNMTKSLESADAIILETFVHLADEHKKSYLDRLINAIETVNGDNAGIDVEGKLHSDDLLLIIEYIH